ncbi:MAG TPA: hypothetical protein VE404_02820 [Verrucomicrobiae bacterium]|nr:hypothetical protein [Verrucomicrobiae bacterium]
MLNVLVAAALVTLTATPFPLPGASGSIGFDDLAFVPKLKRVVIPAGRAGSLYLIDPATKAADPVTGFSAEAPGKTGHGEGVTSADFGRGLLFTTDRTTKKLDVVDPFSKKIVSSAPLSGGPDYVRWVEKTEELWVTEPEDDRIEIFSLPAGAAPVPEHKAFLKVPGGPESLVIDGDHAYTNLWEDATIALDVKERSIAGHWPNGCKGSRGLALDAKRGFLFVGCAEGRAAVLDARHGGKLLDATSAGDGVDIISFDPGLSHLYFPGGKSATMAILGVADSGKLSLLGTVKTAEGSHCVVADDQHQAWVCDPKAGGLLLVADTLPEAAP